MNISVNINGKNMVLDTHGGEMLTDLLRRSGFKGVKKGCQKGDCGACAVLIDGKLINSCIVPAPSIDGKTILTIEGMGTPKKPSIIQKCFVDAGAIQCGFCTPGMILATKALLDKNPNPTEDDIKTALDGNLCRCTGYIKIIDAVKQAAEKIREEDA